VNFFKPTVQSYNEYFARVDHSFGSRDLMFADYYLNDFAQDGVYNPNNLLTYQSFSNIRYQNALISETHIFTTNLLNNFVLNYQREISLRGGPPGSPDITDYGVQNVYPVYPAGASTWNPANYKALDYGRSDFDHPNVVSASYVYMLPHVHLESSVLRAVLNGWRTSGLIQHRSGDALTVTAGKDVSLTGLNQDRGQRTSYVSVYSHQSGKGSCSGTASCVNWIDPSAFALPVNTGPGTGYGNVIKGSIRGPGYTDWDAAMIRTIPIYREASLDFRAEYFDVLNHTLLNDPTPRSPRARSVRLPARTRLDRASRSSLSSCCSSRVLQQFAPRKHSQ
jgi:hypothetical protein